MQEAAEQIIQDAYDSGRPALVSIPSVQPQVAPAEALTQQSTSVMVDDEAKKTIHSPQLGLRLFYTSLFQSPTKNQEIYLCASDLPCND
ncbi:MAG: hypothetical protein EZS28_050313 [Streblomastix strix]|uniref:Uncharacterized protein n=1 Tax=Streblomastix strix TaxID=222440 RepID=A0A5J4T9F6_9EUKA|nr:MAG: hypothetical protein EZS28_050313 [Streblomastix strix]